jgi:hypothetical protein
MRLLTSRRHLPASLFAAAARLRVRRSARERGGFRRGRGGFGSLWGWARPGWGGGYVSVNVNRYNNVKVNRTHINSNVWQPNRPGGRPAELQRPPNGPVGQPARPNGLPANAVGRPNVTVPASAVNRPTKPAGRGPASRTVRPKRVSVRRIQATGPILVKGPAISVEGTRPHRLGQVLDRPRSGRLQHVNPRRSRTWTGAGRRHYIASSINTIRSCPRTAGTGSHDA